MCVWKELKFFLRSDIWSILACLERGPCLLGEERKGGGGNQGNGGGKRRLCSHESQVEKSRLDQDL